MVTYKSNWFLTSALSAVEALMGLLSFIATGLFFWCLVSQLLFKIPTTRLLLLMETVLLLMIGYHHTRILILLMPKLK
jgi:hypothetical protein